jgi:hypothetical protein
MRPYLFLDNGIYAHLSNGPLINEVLDMVGTFQPKSTYKNIPLPLVHGNIIE